MLSIICILALLTEPSVHLWAVKLVIFGALSALCVLTAKDKKGVALGILVVIAVRLAIGVGMIALRSVR